MCLANHRQIKPDEDSIALLPPCLSEAISEEAVEVAGTEVDVVRAAQIEVGEVAVKQPAARGRKKTFSTSPSTWKRRSL
jgi:hypothetical protein